MKKQKTAAFLTRLSSAHLSSGDEPEGASAVQYENSSSSPYTCLVMPAQFRCGGSESSRIRDDPFSHHRQSFSHQSSTAAMPSVIHTASRRSTRRRATRSARSRTRIASSSSSLWSTLFSLVNVILLVLLLSAQSIAYAQSQSQLSPHALPLTASQYQQQPTPAGCEWRSRSSSPALFGPIASEDREAGQTPGAGAGSDTLLTCRFKTINGPLDAGANLNLIPAERTARLALLCEDVLFASSLPPRSFERLKSLQELHIHRCKLRELADDTFVGLRELRKLTVRTHNTDWRDLSLQLSPALFTPVERLESLDLSQNGLKSLPSSLFCPLSRLQTLNVSANSLENIASLGFNAKTVYDSSPPMDDCPRLDAITHLDASYNRIGILTDSGFGRLTRLQVLNLRHNQIIRAEETSLVGLNELTRLDLSYNELVGLPARFLQAVKTTLTELYLQNNSLTVITPFLLSGLSKVTTLDLSYNEITSHWMQPNTFSDMGRLLSLDLSHNKLSRIDAHTFRALFTLQSLSLAHNEIVTLSEMAFSNNHNLHTLSLSNNKLTQIDPNSFTGLHVLNSLALDSNEISTIKAGSFDNITGLTELNLAGNKLNHVPIAVGSLHALQSLDLSGNNISNIMNASYQGLNQLYRLSLNGNAIGNLTKGAFHQLPALRVLTLHENHITTIEKGTFDEVQFMHNLRLDSNALEGVNELFGEMSHLYALNISANRISHFDYAMIPSGLHWLDLHGNQIDALNNYYTSQHNVNLKTLDASDNRITAIDELSLPNSIELVMLNRNLLSKIQPHTFLKKANLIRVDLSENRLSTLELNALRLTRVEERRQLPEFSIGENPFVCDCSLEWLQRVAQSGVGSQKTPTTGLISADPEESRHYPRIVDAHLAQCRPSFSRPGATAQLVPIVSLQPQQFLCPYRTYCPHVCHCCEYEACDCAHRCPFNCSCYSDHSRGTNIVDCGGQQHTVIPKHIPMESTVVYLDGNHIPELTAHAFMGRKALRQLYLNGSHIQAISNATFAKMGTLTLLSLASNELETLQGYEFDELGDLRELYLQYNHLTNIDSRTFSRLTALRIVRLDHNRLVSFSLRVGLEAQTALVHLYIGANDWSCECAFVAELTDWLSSRSAIVRDPALVHCKFNQTYAVPLALLPSETNRAAIEAARANISAACTSDPSQPINPVANSVHGSSATSASGQLSSFPLPTIVFVCACMGGILLLVGVLVTAVLYRHQLAVWIYAKTNIRLSCGRNAATRGPYQGEKLFDIYLSYSKKDEAFVTQMLAPELEYGPTPLRLCLTYRDLPVASGFMGNAIVEAVRASKRTILVVTENFLRHEWCHYEFRSAHLEALRGANKSQLILIMFGPLQSTKLDPDMRRWMSGTSVTLVEWDQKMRWERLRYALPELEPSATSSSSSSTPSSTYGRKGQHSIKNSGSTLLPSLNLLSQSPLTHSRHALDSYGHGAHLGAPIGPLGPTSAHHPLLSSVGTMGHLHTTLGRQHNQYHQQPIYSPASVHSQQSTYAYPTYMPPSSLSGISGNGPVYQSTPPPLPPAHPSMGFQLHRQQQQQQQDHVPFHHQHQHSGHSTTVTSLDSQLSHLPVHHFHQRSSGGHNSSAESSLINSSGATSMTNAGGSNTSDSSGGGGQMPFVPSATSTTAVAVHI